mgnify:CR=1 FL=1|jgi:hypothetical protein
MDTRPILLTITDHACTQQNNKVEEVLHSDQMFTSNVVHFSNPLTPPPEPPVEVEQVEAALGWGWRALQRVASRSSRRSSTSRFTTSTASFTHFVSPNAGTTSGAT